MRTLKLTLMVALAFALGAANASASSIDIIWQVSGTGTTGATGGVHVGDVVLTIGSGDTALGGGGAGITLSATSSGAALIDGSNQIQITSWFDLASVPGGTNPTSANLFSQGDLFGSGATLGAGSSTVIGTITVSDTGAGGVLINLSTGGNDIVNPGGVSIASEFTFGGGNIVPEPTTASLLGLGLLGLSIAGRNRKN